MESVSSQVFGAGAPSRPEGLLVEDDQRRLHESRQSIQLTVNRVSLNQALLEIRKIKIFSG